MENKSVNIFYSELNLLSKDNLSGSKEILSKLNDLIINNLNYIEFNESFFNNLNNTFPSFEAVHSYLSRLKNASAEKDKSKVFEFLKSFQNTNRESYRIIHRKLKKKITDPAVFITLSNSETIFEILKLLNEESLVKKVIVSESRPQNEGRIIAEKLMSNNIKVELIVEAQIADKIPEIDAALIGADKILVDGKVINKIGSKILALSCKYYKKPIYVISDSGKYSTDTNFTQIQRPQNEIWQNLPEKVTVSNYYFEEINGELITEIISDR